MDTRKIIYDGDMGGDDLWAIAMLLAHRDKIDLLGMATVYGNVSQPYATQNLLNFLHWLKIDNIEVVQGADNPCDGMRPFGDEAYGSNGVGGVILPESPVSAKQVDIAEWYNTRLDANPDCTILVTGPATNIALFLDKYPEKANKIGEIIFMGGGLNPPGKDGKPVYLENGQQRIGNITEYAEFNAYQDPKALNIILQSGASMTFMSADASQFVVLTPERQTQVKALHPKYGPDFCRMLMVVADLDMSKFGVDGPFIHDPNVTAYLLRPDFYTGVKQPNLSFTEGTPDDPHRGQAVLLTDGNANAFWLNGFEKDKNELLDWMLESLKTTIDRAS